MISKSTRILKILIIVYAVLYLAAIVSSLFDKELSFTEIKDILFLLLFVMLSAGIGLLWKREKTAAILFMVWNTGIWITDLYLGSGEDRGMLSVMAVPVMVVGALLLLERYKSCGTQQPSVPEKWKYILRVLLINYAVLYSIVVVSELYHGELRDYYRLPFILLPVIFLVFILGFAFSWKREFHAGIIFLAWYAILFMGSAIWHELGDSGPWILFGIPVLLQGLFYIKNYLWYKTRQT
jgi:hypothetical protein